MDVPKPDRRRAQGVDRQPRISQIFESWIRIRHRGVARITANKALIRPAVSDVHGVGGSYPMASDNNLNSPGSRHSVQRIAWVMVKFVRGRK